MTQNAEIVVARPGPNVGWLRSAAAIQGAVRAAGHRWHHLLLLAWLGVWVELQRRHGGQSWHFFATGSRSLLCTPPEAGGCGLHVYAVHPELQIGPLSFLVAGLVDPWRQDEGVGIAEVVMALAGLVVLVALEQDARRDTPTSLHGLLRWRVLLGGLVFIPAWTDVAVRFAHLDDVLALVFTTGAICAVSRRWPVATGVCLALATLSKPWAIAFLPLVLALPDGRRRALGWAVLPTGIVAALFLVADPHTMNAAHFAIPNAAASSLRLLGATQANTPAWDRPAQFLLGMTLAGIAVWKSRWRAVVMIAAGTRILLDPGIYSYYTASILLGALAWDLHARKGRAVPAWSWLIFGALFACRYLPLPPSVLAALRLGVCVVIIICALWLPPILNWLVPRRRRAHRRAGPARIRPVRLLPDHDWESTPAPPMQQPPQGPPPD